MRTVGLVIGGVCVGLVLGFLLGLSQRETPRVAPAVDTKPQSQPVKAADTDRSEPERPASDASAAELQPQFAFDLPLPTGSGEATGRVRLADGSPCADLTLRATPQFAPLNHQQVQRMGVEERLAYEAASTRRLYEGVREAKTAQDGTFTFSELADVQYLLVALTPGWKIKLDRSSGTPSVKAGSEIELVAWRLAAVPLRVLLPDGQEAPSARVMSISAPTGATEYGPWTPRQRVVEVVPGEVTLRVNATPDDTLVAELTVQVPADSSVNEVTIQLQRSPGVYITLELPEPYYADLAVALLPAENLLHADSRSDPWLNRDGKTSRQVKPNQWYFANVAPGDYVFFLGVTHVVTLLRERITASEGVMEFKFQPGPLDTRDHFTVRVFDASGSPLSRVRLSCTLDGSDVVLGDMTAYLATDPGTYLMRRPQARADGLFVPTDGRDIVVLASLGGARRFGRLPSSGSEVEIRFDEGCTLVVEVSNLPELGRNDLWVAVVPAAASMDRESQLAKFNSSQPAGAGTRNSLRSSQEFKDLQAGPATVLVMRTADKPQSAIFKQEITIKPGMETIKIAMPDLHELLVRVPKDYARKGMSVLGGDLEVTGMIEGQVLRVQALPAGDYWVGGYDGYMKVTLPAAAGFDFTPSPANCIYLYAYDKPGVLYAQGLRKGDKIVSVNGQTAEGHEALKNLWESARKADSVRLEIDRRSEILFVTITGKDLDQAMRDGARTNYRCR